VQSCALITQLQRHLRLAIPDSLSRLSAIASDPLKHADRAHTE
jgi:hypothetical protein